MYKNKTVQMLMGSQYSRFCQIEQQISDAAVIFMPCVCVCVCVCVFKNRVPLIISSCVVGLFGTNDNHKKIMCRVQEPCS